MVSEHVWSQEQIAAYLADGLSSEECDRLERHAKECPECAAALAAAQHFDRGLGTLFAPLRPKSGLEDRAVQAVRLAPKPALVFFVGWPRRITAAAAAIVALTTFGALAASMMNDGRLPLPGERRTARATESPVILVPDLAGADDSPVRRKGYGPSEATTAAASADGIPDLNRLSEKTIDDIVTADPNGVVEGKLGKEGGGETKSRFAITGDKPSAPPAPPTKTGPAAGFGNGFGGGFAGGGFGMQPGMSTYTANGNLHDFYSGVPGGTPLGTMPMSGSGPAPGGASVLPPGPGLPQGVPPAVPTAPAVTPPGYFVPNDAKPAFDHRSSENKRQLKDEERLKGRSENGAAKGDEPKPPSFSEPNKASDSNKPADPQAAPEAARRIVVRSGDIEFEVESFDSALATVALLTTKIKGAFVGTVNSDKLPNGKVKGSIVVRTPPEFLDTLVLDLRKELGKGGELKSVRLASADITKQYTDLESRLKAARAMETRLLDIIKTGKGEIKQLLEAERELGVWRTKIEESEGEIRYLANLAALSTLTITLTEKEIRAAVGVTENERVQAGVEVEDVDKTYQAVLKEVVDAKGRVTKSELKQLSAGQFNATLNFEVAPEAGGPIRDRLRQLGRVARLEIDRVQQADGALVPKDAKVKRGDTVFMVQLYNLANIAPRETATISVAVSDVSTAYNAIRDAIAKASGRVQVAQLNEQDKQNVTAQLDFDMKRTDEGAIRTALAATGETTSRQVGRVPESDSVTDTKIQYKITLFALSRIRPRDAVTQQIAVPDVAASYASIQAVLAASKARVLASQLDENDKQNVTASVDFEVQRTEEAAVKSALDSAGETVSRQLAHAAENEAATDTKVLYRMTLLPANRLKPRETTTLGLEVQDVDQTMRTFVAELNEVKGRQIDAKSGRERNGKMTARLVYEVPLAAAPGIVEKFKSAGTIRVLNASRDPQAPEGKSATARIDVTIANVESIVNPDDGLWPPVKKGLSYSASVLLTSMTWVVFGLCVVLPWAVLGYGGYRVVRRFTTPSKVDVVSPPVTPAPEPTA